MRRKGCARIRCQRIVLPGKSACLHYSTVLLTSKARLRQACKRANRSPAEVKLVAVTKTVPTDIIKQAYGAGLRVFGENRVQEAQPKIGKLPADYRVALHRPLAIEQGEGLCWPVRT